MITRVLGSLALIVFSPVAFASERATTAYDFTFISIEGDHLPLSDFQGQVLLVVNTASFCGFTRQYDDLQEVWQRYRDRGLVVLGVPSNDFGSQEPGTEAEIKDFCEINFAIDFPMTEKVGVKGEDAHPFYRWAKDELGADARPRWNFHKYLVGPDGHLVGWFPTATKPTSDKVVNAIEAQLRSIGRDGS
jgi:glutathione peroxidase